MCRLEKRVYINADGARSEFEESFPCDMASSSQFCSNVQRKMTEYYPRRPSVTRNQSPRVIEMPTAPSMPSFQSNGSFPCQLEQQDSSLPRADSRARSAAHEARMPTIVIEHSPRTMHRRSSISRDRTYSPSISFTRQQVSPTGRRRSVKDNGSLEPIRLYAEGHASHYSYHAPRPDSRPEAPSTTTRSALVKNLASTVCSDGSLAEECGWQPGRPKFLWEKEAETQLEVTERRLLGRGTIGEVHEVRVPGYQRPMARKRIFISRIKQQAKRDRAMIKTEIENLRDLDHIHIVKILGCYEEETGNKISAFCALIYPAADGDLGQFLYEECQPASDLQKEWIKTWFGCLASALAYMHSQNIHHEDIKPTNIVYHQNRILFTDFSSSRRLEAGQDTSTDSPAMASRLFAAPEAMRDDGTILRHGSKSDVYSLALVYIEMLVVLLGEDVGEMRDFVFEEARQTMRYCAVIDKIFAFLTDPKKCAGKPMFWPWCLRNMLYLDRKARPTAQEVVRFLVADYSAGQVNRCPCSDSARSAQNETTAFQDHVAAVTSGMAGQAEDKVERLEDPDLSSAEQSPDSDGKIQFSAPVTEIPWHAQVGNDDFVWVDKRP